MAEFKNDLGLNPYDCVYQGWCIICFGTPDKNTIEQLPDCFPYVVGVLDSKIEAINIAKTMKSIGKKKYGKNYTFIVQGVGISGKWPIIGLDNEVSIRGFFGDADRTEIVI